MAVRITWHGQRTIAQVNKRTRIAIQRSAIMLTNAIKKSISIGNADGMNPSKPGQPPHVVTGLLRSSVGYEVHNRGLTARVGASAKYTLPLELGSAAHPITAHGKALAIPIAGGRIKSTGTKAFGKRIAKGDILFRKTVNHPGNAPRPFLRPAFKRNKAAILKTFRDAYRGL